MWFTSQVKELLLRKRASVNYTKFFRAPCRKKYALDQKMDGTFFDGLHELYHHAKFGEDRTGTMHAGCRCENVVFVFVCFFCHAPSPQHRAFEGCIVRTSIALPFVARFRRGFQPFFTMCKNYAGCALRRSCVFSSRLFSNFYLFSYSLLKYFILYELPYCDTATGFSTWHLHHSPLELKNFASHFYCTVWIYD